LRLRQGLRLSITLGLAVALCGCIMDTGDDSPDGDLRIEGHVRDEAGSPVEGVTIKGYLSYDAVLHSASTCSVRTDSRGFYRMAFEPSLVEITVLPRKTECTFRPAKISYYRPRSPLTNEDFTAACGVLYTISGRVTDTEGDPVVGAAITIRDNLNRWDKTVFTDTGGSYSIANVVPGLTYSVTPFLSSCDFEPPGRTYDDLGSDFEDQNFTAICESGSDMTQADR
jgi:hypothetical protein